DCQLMEPAQVLGRRKRSLLASRKRRRIEDQAIVFGFLTPQARQPLEDIARYEPGGAFGKHILTPVLLGPTNRGSGEIDRRDVARPSPTCSHGKAAGIGEGIEHTPALRTGLKPVSERREIQKQSRMANPLELHQERPPPFTHTEVPCGHLAKER